MEGIGIRSERNSEQKRCQKTYIGLKCELISYLIFQLMRLFSDFLLKAEYPSSSKKPKNWDRIAADVEAEEKNDNLEG